MENSFFSSIFNKYPAINIKYIAIDMKYTTYRLLSILSYKNFTTK